jgi:hypothetical protein
VTADGGFAFIMISMTEDTSQTADAASARDQM